MATHQGTRNDRQRAGALSGEHRGRAKNLTVTPRSPIVAMRSMALADAAICEGRL